MTKLALKVTSKSTVSLHEFSEQTTVHGLPKILSNDSTASKCVWLILFAGAIALFLIQGITLLSDYFKYPTRTVLGTERLKEFPSVTLCNLRHIDLVLHLLLHALATCSATVNLSRVYSRFNSTSLLFGTGCVDGSGSLSGGAFNQLKLVTLSIV